MNKEGKASKLEEFVFLVPFIPLALAIGFKAGLFISIYLFLILSQCSWHLWKLRLSFYLFFGCTSQYVGSQFPDKGSNPCPHSGTVEPWPLDCQRISRARLFPTTFCKRGPILHLNYPVQGPLVVLSTCTVASASEKNNCLFHLIHLYLNSTCG